MAIFGNTSKNTYSPTNLTTLISKATEITGDLHFSGALEVEGRIFGNIYAQDDSSAEVRIRESGLVKGEIRAPLVVINGLVEGDVYSNNHIELAAKAKVLGDVYYNLIEMVMGSEVNGALRHTPSVDLSPKQLPSQKAQHKTHENLQASAQEKPQQDQAPQDYAHHNPYHSE